MQLVEKDSAILGYPQEKISQPDADHHGVCKFKNVDDPKYILVRNMLKWLAASIKPQRELRRPLTELKMTVYRGLPSASAS
jgi:hypothetical protein